MPFVEIDLYRIAEKPLKEYRKKLLDMREPNIIIKEKFLKRAKKESEVKEIFKKYGREKANPKNSPFYKDYIKIYKTAKEYLNNMFSGTISIFTETTDYYDDSNESSYFLSLFENRNSGIRLKYVEGCGYIPKGYTINLNFRGKINLALASKNSKACLTETMTQKKLKKEILILQKEIKNNRSKL